MNFRLLSKVLGLLLLLLSSTMFLCLIFAYLDQERRPGLDAVDSFGISITLTCATGSLLVFLGRRTGREIMRREAIAIVGLGWFICTAFGALPYVFCEPNLSPPQAFFEAMSGFTTTGASVIANLDEFPRGILLWRSLTQWLGGMGILVLFVALLSYLGVGSKALFHHESTVKSGEGLRARIRDVAARLWQIYVSLTVICAAGLVALGMSFYDAITHTFTAVSTGGFSVKNASIAAYNNVWIELWLMLFMTLGAISFMLYAWLLAGRWERWRKEEETKVFLCVLAIISLAIALDLAFFRVHDFWGAIRVSSFQVISIMTTTGFVTADYDVWPPFSRVLLLLLMFVGGCAGSTAGGIKVSRLILFFRIIRVAVVAAFRPNQVISVTINGNHADDLLKIQTVFFVALAGFSAAAGTALLSLFEPRVDILTSFSAVCATLFNIGPGLGLVGPTQNFGHFEPGTMFLLSLFMVLGRLEFFAVLVLFFPSLWKKY